MSDDSDEDSSSSSSDEEVKNPAKETPKETVAQVTVSDADAGKTELFVTGLSYETNDATLRGTFEKFGTLTKCKLLYNKGKAFV